MLPILAAIAVEEIGKLIGAVLLGIGIGHAVTREKYKEELEKIQNRVEVISNEIKRRRS